MDWNGGKSLKNCRWWREQRKGNQFNCLFIWQRKRFNFPTPSPNNSSVVASILFVIFSSLAASSTMSLWIPQPPPQELPNEMENIQQMSWTSTTNDWVCKLGISTTIITPPPSVHLILSFPGGGGCGRANKSFILRHAVSVHTAATICVSRCAGRFTLIYHCYSMG